MRSGAGVVFRGFFSDSLRSSFFNQIIGLFNRLYLEQLLLQLCFIHQEFDYLILIDLKHIKENPDFFELLSSKLGPREDLLNRPGNQPPLVTAPVSHHGEGLPCSSWTIGENAYIASVYGIFKQRRKFLVYFQLLGLVAKNVIKGKFMAFLLVLTFDKLLGNPQCQLLLGQVAEDRALATAKRFDPYIYPYVSLDILDIILNSNVSLVYFLVHFLQMGLLLQLLTHFSLNSLYILKHFLVLFGYLIYLYLLILNYFL